MSMPTPAAGVRAWPLRPPYGIRRPAERCLPGPLADTDTIVIDHDHPHIHGRTRTNDGHIDRSGSRLDRALGRYGH